jgi:hypothetical protein
MMMVAGLSDDVEWHMTEITRGYDGIDGGYQMRAQCGGDELRQCCDGDKIPLRCNNITAAYLDEGGSIHRDKWDEIKVQEEM